MRGAAEFAAESQAGKMFARLSGAWTLACLPTPIPALDQRLRALVATGAAWDLSAVTQLDSAGALLLWRAWGRTWPADIVVSDALRHVIERAAMVSTAVVPQAEKGPSPLVWLGEQLFSVIAHLRDGVTLIGALILDLLWLCAHPREIPVREILANIYKCGALALPVTALVGFLIGVVLSYLSSLQLRLFGAETFIVNILGMSIIRELGPVLVAVLVAGRSGSAMTAQIGVMRVTEEIDALATMGVSRTLRLVLPKVLALALAMPLLVVWCSAAGILGGLVAANLQLDLSWGFFIERLPRSVPLPNLWIGLSKGLVFGLLIGLIACHFGLRVKPNTESLSTKTTSSVVAAITVVILVDAVFAIFTRNIGMPL
ncbi:MAG: ABC transporter permease [Zoogloeaceae bacterium]|nr:ABC transporter permease [Zoogloeaceae bacterium]